MVKIFCGVAQIAWAVGNAQGEVLEIGRQDGRHFVVVSDDSLLADPDMAKRSCGELVWYFLPPPFFTPIESVNLEAAVAAQLARKAAGEELPMMSLDDIIFRC